MSRAAPRTPPRPRASTPLRRAPALARDLGQPQVDELLEETSLLDLVDNVLNRGVVVSGDVTLGVAGVDLVYLRLSALLCAADRVLPQRRRRRAR